MGWNHRPRVLLYYVYLGGGAAIALAIAIAITIASHFVDVYRTAQQFVHVGSLAMEITCVYAVTIRFARYVTLSTHVPGTSVQDIIRVKIFRWFHTARPRGRVTRPRPNAPCNNRDKSNNSAVSVSLQCCGCWDFIIANAVLRRRIS